MDRTHACRTSPSVTRSIYRASPGRRGIPACSSRATTSLCGPVTPAMIPKSTRNCRESPLAVSTICTILVVAHLREASVSLSRNTNMKNRMAKNRMAVAAVIIATLLAPACTNLTETPQSAITPNNFYRNADEAVGGLASVYAQLRQTIEGAYELTEVSSDEIVIPTRGQDWLDHGKGLDLHHPTLPPNSPTA